MINDPTRPLHCLYTMKDTGLTMTGGHSILVDELVNENLNHSESTKLFYTLNQKIEDKYLLLACTSKLFEPILDTNIYTIYHFVLESEKEDTRFGVYANHVLTETISKEYYLDSNFLNIL